MNNGNVVGFGGRVKGAAVGMNHLMGSEGLDERLRDMRERPSFELLKAFFPGDHARMRQVMRGPGFYRPVLKTDQGMPGNFFRFQFDRAVQATDLSVRTVVGEEGVAIPEPWVAHHDASYVQRVQEYFARMDLRTTAQMLEQIEHASREAQKGRGAFFFIRPGELDRPIIFGRDIIPRVENAIGDVVYRLDQEAQRLASEHGAPWHGANMVYGQFDVFVTTSGEVCVERVNLPDVGFFMTELSCVPSRLLPEVQHIVYGIRKEVCERLATIGPHITLVTRDEVVDRQEDLLEIREIESICKGLAEYGVVTTTVRASDVKKLRLGTTVVLLNIDYSSAGGQVVLDAYSSGQVICFPNPFMQMAAKGMSGLTTHQVPDKHLKRFLDLVRSVPKDEQARNDVLRRLHVQLEASDLHGDILHVDVGDGFVPVWRHALHSWRQIANRASDKVVIKSLPVHPGNLLITSDTGSRLHAFRFAWVSG